MVGSLKTSRAISKAFIPASTLSPEEEIAKKFNFKPDTKKRKSPRYKQLCNLKKKFYALAKEALENEDVL